MIPFPFVLNTSGKIATQTVDILKSIATVANDYTLLSEVISCCTSELFKATHASFKLLSAKGISGTQDAPLVTTPSCTGTTREE